MLVPAKAGIQSKSLLSTNITSVLMTPFPLSTKKINLYNYLAFYTLNFPTLNAIIPIAAGGMY